MIPLKIDHAKHNGPIIELNTPLGDIDLHNFADLVKMEIENDEILFVWKESESGRLKLGDLTISQFDLVFHKTKIRKFLISPLDTDDEEISLDYFIVEHRSGDTSCFQFFFFGGLNIEFESNTVSMQYK